VDYLSKTRAIVVKLVCWTRFVRGISRIWSQCYSDSDVAFSWLQDNLFVVSVFVRQQKYKTSPSTSYRLMAIDGG
jgi:hypothetical protein